MVACIRAGRDYEDLAVVDFMALFATFEACKFIKFVHALGDKVTHPSALEASLSLAGSVLEVVVKTVHAQAALDLHTLQKSVRSRNVKI